MLATVAGYEFDVDRGPDWLWIRVRSLEAGSSPAASLAEQLKELVEKHFIYRIVLELHRVPELSSQLIGELVRTGPVHPNARWRAAGVRALAGGPCDAGDVRSG